jgi:NAD-dependent dihydropyrimidine dehydrogenase PreA subunit
VITIDVERCTGSGACVEVCPTGAIYLVEDRATVDQSLCNECEACIAACPTEAITLATPERSPVAEPVLVPARRAEPAVVQVRTLTVPVPLRTRVLPIVGAGLAWAGREIVPRLADTLLDALDRWTARQQTAGIARDPGSAVRGGKGSGRQWRRRRRGGGRSS